MTHIQIPEHIRVACLLLRDKQATLDGYIHKLLADLATSNGMTGDLQYDKDMTMIYKPEEPVKEGGPDNVPARPDGGA